MQAAARERRTRLTYLLFFRVVVVSLLLAARLVEDITAPDGFALGFSPGLGLVVLAYASAIAFSLSLRRAETSAAIDRIAAVQIVLDLLCATLLVHLTGGIESQLAFTYLIIVAGAGLLFPRGTIWTAAAAALLYSALLVARRVGLLPRIGQFVIAPPRELLRAALLHTVAIFATGLLAARLAKELVRAGASLVRASAQFEDLATLYADVVRSLSSGLVTLGVDGRVATANQAAISILGVLGDDLLGRPLELVIPGIAELLHPARSVRREELAFLDGAGKARRLGVTLSPLVDARDLQIGQIVTFQDLTELRAMEEAVTRQKRLAAIGRLAAGIAHEIRNPLAAISGSIELLVSSGIGETSADAQELSQIVLREVGRLNTLITELLEFARPRVPELQRLDLAETTNELVQVFQNDKRLHDTRVELIAPAPVYVDADPNQLRQVLWNLLRNAAEAAPGRPIHVDIGRDGARARLTVRDEGPGIDDDSLSRVFEPFFSTKQTGSGLGLPTVHRIVEEHRGTIELARNDAGGMAATVHLPLVA